MNKIIILVADTGSGKDFVLSQIQKYDGIEIVKRYTNRSPRLGEEENTLSTIFNTPVSDIKKLTYNYEGVEEGNFYGVSADDLYDTLKRGKSPVIIFPNYDSYVRMCMDFDNLVVPIFIYRGIEETYLEAWRESLIKRGSSEEEIEKRESKRSFYFEELYVKHTCEFSENVILNLFGLTTPEDICMQFTGLALKNDIDLYSPKRKL